MKTLGLLYIFITVTLLSGCTSINYQPTSPSDELETQRVIFHSDFGYVIGTPHLSTTYGFKDQVNFKASTQCSTAKPTPTLYVDVELYRGYSLVASHSPTPKSNVKVLQGIANEKCQPNWTYQGRSKHAVEENGKLYVSGKISSSTAKFSTCPTSPY